MWSLSSQHPIIGDDLQGALQAVAVYRNVAMMTLDKALEGYPDLAQTKWAAWRRKQFLTDLPPRFADVLHGIVAFADPALRGEVAGRVLRLDNYRWQ